MSKDSLLRFVQGMVRLIEDHADERSVLLHGRALLAELVAKDDWLPDAFAQAHPRHYQQYLLYADPLDRLSVVSFVWGPGQKTPPHNHMTWGLVGCLRGRERETKFELLADGTLKPKQSAVLHPGQTTTANPAFDDVHEVENDLADSVSVSIHVYGRNIGRVNRHIFNAQTGAISDFVSGYANELVPIL